MDFCIQKKRTFKMNLNQKPMENPTQPLTAYMLKYGGLLGGISIIFALMLFSLDMHYGQEDAVNYVNYAISISVIVLGIHTFRKDNDGYLGLGEAIKLGLGISLVSAIIAVVYTALLMYVLEPGYMAKVMDFAKEKMIDDNPEMSQEELQMTLDMMEKFQGIGVIAGFILIFSLFFGFLTSLVTGLILKRARPE